MIFTTVQIQEILAALRRWELVFICNQLGTDFLSSADKAVLKAAGVDLKQFKDKKGTLEHAYLFGILAAALEDERAKAMNYAQFQRFVASGNWVPLTDSEEFALDQLKNRAYTDISGLGSRMKTGVTNVLVRSNLEQQGIIRDQIKNRAIQAVELRMSPRSLASDLADLTQDWGRDWMRIAYYLMHEAYNTGRAQTILRDHGADALVYHDVYKDACKHCKEFFLEVPEDPDSMPKVFKLSELLANGNNIGRKVADWKPVIAPVHPYCRCELNYKQLGYEWDAELRAFVKPVKYQPKNPSLQNVKLDIEISKAEGDEIEKGRSFPVGTARRWGDQWVQKQSDKTWKPFTPIGKGGHGDIYDAFKNKPYAAVSFLLKQNRGEAVGVWSRPDLGDISLVKGNIEGMLLHVFEKHLVRNNDFESATDAVRIINQIIKKGSLSDDVKIPKRKNISHNGYKMILDQRNGRWFILTVYRLKSKKRSAQQKATMRKDIERYKIIKAAE